MNLLSTAQGAPILVVDDDTGTRELVATYLRREGFDVREAASGEAALELMAGQAIGLVLLDLALPGISGIDVVRALREQPTTATLPIIVLTGNGEDYPLTTSLGVGADDYLTKPIQRQELVARVRARLRSQHAAVEFARRGSEELYRALVEHSADGILVSDQSGRYVEANPSICRMLGYSRDELLAMFTPSLSADDDPLTPEDMDVRLAETAAGTGLLVERRYRRRDGTSLAAEVSFSQLPDGRLQRNIRDITDRLAAEAALRESERSLAEAQRLAHIGSWEWDLTTDTARRSEELHRIYGVEPGSIPETTEAFLDFVHPDDRARVQAAERAAVTGGGRYALEYRAVRPDGSIRIIRDDAEVVRDTSGSPVRMVGTVRDITERVAAEVEHARLAAAVEQTGDAVWIKDPDGTITYVNPAFCGLYGYERDEIVGRGTSIIASGRHEDAFFDAIWASVALGKTWAGTIVNRRKGGALIELAAVISGIRDESGRLISYMQTDRDVTREHALESALERNARERDIIERALERIGPDATPEAIATSACAEMMRLPDVDSAFVIALDGDGHGLMLAVDGRVAPVFVSSRVIPGNRAGYLWDRASVGAWTEDWHARAADGAYGEQVTATGLRTVAYAPLRGPGGVIGVIGLGTHDRAGESLVEQLPVLTTLASILGTLLSPGLETRYREDDARARVQAILAAAAFTPFFQPIVDLHSGSVVGYEALSRFADGVPPDVTFALAIRSGLGLELETATLGAALEAATALPPGAFLSLNASPGLISSGALRAMFDGVARPLVLEVTEHVAIDDYPTLRHALAALGPNVRLAVDDAGAGYASLRHILELVPGFVKLDIGLIRGIDADPARQALIAGMSYFAAKRKLQLVAEGIETQAELHALTALAVGFGQGYLLGRPQDGRGPGPWPTKIAVAIR